MAKRILIAVNLALATALVWSLLGQSGASGASGTRFLNLAAVGFTPLNYSTHNSNSTVCAAYQPQRNHVADQHDFNGENRGQLDNASGSFVHDIAPGQGVKVKSFSLFVHDADGDNNTYAYLVRHRIAPTPFPKAHGYSVMASVHSKGADNQNLLKKYSTTNITAATVDQTRFVYFVELVNCGASGNPEPFAVQIAYTT